MYNLSSDLLLDKNKNQLESFCIQVYRTIKKCIQSTKYNNSRLQKFHNAQNLALDNLSYTFTKVKMNANEVILYINFVIVCEVKNK